MDPELHQMLKEVSGLEMVGNLNAHVEMRPEKGFLCPVSPEGQHLECLAPALPSFWDTVITVKPLALTFQNDFSAPSPHIYPALDILFHS